MLERADLIRVWYDQTVQPGDNWEKAIDTYLNKAQIILLIASASFIDSDYCYDKVMPHALTHQESGQTRVLAVILHPCDWKVTPLGRLQALPTDSLPITLWSNQQSALLNVTEGVKRIADELQVEGLLKAGEALYQAEQYDEALASFDYEYKVQVVRFSLDDQLLVSTGGAGFSSEFMLWDLSSGKSLATDNGFSNITFSPDGRFLAYTFLGDWDIAVREIPSGDYYQSLRGHENSVLNRYNSVYALAFSPNSRFLLGGCRDNTIRLWDLSHKEVQQTLYGHTANVDRLAFSPDGYTLASGSCDGIIKLWRWQ